MNNIQKIDTICFSCNTCALGTKMNTLNAGLTATPRTKYNGDLLTSAQVNFLNNMCQTAKNVSLGTIVNNLLTASKQKGTITIISDDYKNAINKMCGGMENAALGTLIQELGAIVNDMADDDQAEILTYKIGEATGTITSAAGTVAVTVPSGTEVTNLVATFTLSEDATAKVGETAQVSGTTANDFTNPVTYVVTAEDRTTTKNWVVTVTVAA